MRSDFSLKTDFRQFRSGFISVQQSFFLVCTYEAKVLGMFSESSRNILIMFSERRWKAEEHMETFPHSKSPLRKKRRMRGVS